VACSVIVVAAILFYLLYPRGPGAASKWAYYVNDSTGAETKRLATEIPPTADNMVQEIKIRCGSKVKVAYYLKYIPEAHDKLVELAQQTPTGTDAHQRRDEFMKIEDLKQQVRRAGEQVRLPAPGSPWVMGDTQQGADIKNSAQCEGDEPAVLVSP
jgi:hypothetical protein